MARLGGERLPTGTIDTIIARTDGVPLFVEELTKAVLETGEASIPASLHDSLMARLDRIPEVKEVAQIGACIGREFSLRAAGRGLPLPDDRARASAGRLVAAELIFRRGRRPTPPTPSSMRWSRTPPTSPCSRQRAAASMRRIADAWSTMPPARSRSTPSCWPTTARPRPVGRGDGMASGGRARLSAPPTPRRSAIYRGRS